MVDAVKTESVGETMVEADLWASGRVSKDRVFTGLMGTLSRVVGVPLGRIEVILSGALSMPITEIGEECTALVMRSGLWLLPVRQPLRALAFEEKSTHYLGGGIVSGIVILESGCGGWGARYVFGKSIEIVGLFIRILAVLICSVSWCILHINPARGGLYSRDTITHKR